MFLFDPSTFLEASGAALVAYVVLVRGLKERALARLDANAEEDATGAPDALDQRTQPAIQDPAHDLRVGSLSVRLAAMEATATARGPQAVPALAALLTDPTPEVAEHAANLLGRIGGREALLALLAADQAPQPVAASPPPPTASTSEETASPPAPAGLDLTAAEGDQLPEDDQDAPGRACLRLLEPLTRSGFRPLHRYTPHDPRDLNEAELAAALLALARNVGEKGALRYFAVQNLAKFRHPDIGETLRDLLSDPTALVRYAAAECLTTHGDADAVPALVAALSDPEGNVRASAAHTLAALGGDQAIRPLLGLRDDPDEVVRYAARRALAQIGKRKKMGSLLRRA